MRGTPKFRLARVQQGARDAAPILRLSEPDVAYDRTSRRLDDIARWGNDYVAVEAEPLVSPHRAYSRYLLSSTGLGISHEVTQPAGMPIVFQAIEMPVGRPIAELAYYRGLRDLCLPPFDAVVVEATQHRLKA